MATIALLAIYTWQKGYLWISSILLGIAINIKMSGILLVPGYILTVAFRYGLIKVVLSLTIIIIV